MGRRRPGGQAVERFGLDGPVDRWRRLRQEIHDDVCQKGYDADRNTFTQFYGSRGLDAALLLIPRVGFLPWDDPRVSGTVDAVAKELDQDGFLLRYRPDADGGVDGLPGTEGAFLACTFWLADALAGLRRTGRPSSCSSGCWGCATTWACSSEENDVHAQRQVGNTPQAFSHVGLVNTARHLSGSLAAHETGRQAREATDDRVSRADRPTRGRTARRATGTARRRVPSTGSPAPPISCAGRVTRITVELRGTDTGRGRADRAPCGRRRPQHAPLPTRRPLGREGVHAVKPQTVVVTGASAGIGRAVAVAFGGAGRHRRADRPRADRPRRGREGGRAGRRPRGRAAARRRRPRSGRGRRRPHGERGRADRRLGQRRLHVGVRAVRPDLARGVPAGHRGHLPRLRVRHPGGAAADEGARPRR